MSRCGMRSGGEVAEPIVDSLSGIFLNLATAMPDVFMRRMGMSSPSMG